MKDDVSLRLDGCLLRFMDQLESLEEKRQRFNSLIEQGWFSISKARYAMGNKQVSALQYGSEIQPQVRVCVRELTGGVTEFQAEREETQGSEDPKTKDDVEDCGPMEGGLRRRTTAKTKNPQEEPVPVKECVSKDDVRLESKGLQRHQDPLKWFGILVPQSLKQAQVAFRQVIELSAEIAALQGAVISTREELHNLLEEKRRQSH
ncbi:coiled-coil domain-containing protein 115 [Paramormyrops kingsleyae]|uniref:Vacuolar ATPase assembly protein VMA22 n=1 Tax=Paramormyrops kingsleyae TaxID=1676925 RepID=A0A3B3S1L8_9TELE|nr:coiled-coil domain-containing protein 115 [Paramormyrops kingsleyae]